jgi:hypothetical protein
MNLPRFMVNFLLSTAFATSFIALFFFTYVKNIEREIVLDNVNYVIDDLTTTFLTILPEPIKALLEFKLDNIELKDKGGLYVFKLKWTFPKRVFS